MLVFQASTIGLTLLLDVQSTQNVSSLVFNIIISLIGVLCILCYEMFVAWRYVYVTFLRDPVYRYLSEFKHVQRGATWKNVKLKCNGKSAAGTVVPLCYSGICHLQHLYETISHFYACRFCIWVLLFVVGHRKCVETITGILLNSYC